MSNRTQTEHRWQKTGGCGGELESLLSHWSAAVCGGKDHFLCASGICIPQKLVCNGYNDCDDWSDETHCGETAVLGGDGGAVVGEASRSGSKNV